MRVCVRPCVRSCQPPTMAFSCASAEIYDHGFSYNRVGFLFWNPSGAADRGDQREEQVLQPKTGDSNSGLARLKRGLKKKWSPKSLDTSIFISWRFARTPSASHINTLALASTGVYWSGLQGSRGQSGVMKSNWPNHRVCCWSLEIAEGFHYGVLWWRECKGGY